MPLDPRDKAILRLLQVNGRLSNAELADKISLSQSACFRRVRALEDSGYIVRYAAVLDEMAVGLPGVAFIMVTLEQQGRPSLDRFEAAVARHPEILECYLLAGAADYIMRVVYADAADLERIHTSVLTQLPGVSRVQSTLTLRNVKKTSTLPI